MEDLSLTGRRPEGRIGLEIYFDDVAAFASVFKEKRLRNPPEKGIALLRIFLTVLFELALLIGIVRKPQDAFAFISLLAGAQRPACNRDQAVKRPRFGFDNFSGFLFAVHLFD